MRVYVGLDLGKSTDYSALVVVHAGAELFGGTTFHVRHLERYPLGTGYDMIADRVRHLVQRLESHPNVENVTLLVDTTGVGNACTDLLGERGVPFVGIGIHGGGKVRRTNTGYNVPKVTLVDALERALEGGLLKVAAGLPLGDVLQSELQGFRRKQNRRTGNVFYEHCSSQDHDDLVLALAMALWGARALTH